MRETAALIFIELDDRQMPSQQIHGLQCGFAQGRITLKFHQSKRIRDQKGADPGPTQRRDVRTAAQGRTDVLGERCEI